MQLANIAFGGTLIEDIKKELGHKYQVPHHQMRELNMPPEKKVHEVCMEPNSALAKIIGSGCLRTNSMHHQAIRDLAPPLRAAGYANDGIIEAVELAAADLFFYGVQWHPESLPDDDASIRLYTALLDAARHTQTLDSGM